MLDRREKFRHRLLFLGLAIVGLVFVSGTARARTYDFDEGIEILTKGLLSVKRQQLKGEKIAVFGIIESNSNRRWEISNHIEDGIVDVLVNEGYTVIERRRIKDIIQKELKKSADFWFNQAQVTQVGKLVGAGVVITGNYVRWGSSSLRISIRAISVSDGKILAANKVKILTDRIADLLKPPSEPLKDRTRGAKAVSPEETDASRNQSQSEPFPSSNQPARTPKSPTPTVNPPSSQPYPSSNPPASPQVTPPQMGSYCCDQYGNRRCMLVQPFPLGSGCFCPGQGYGYTCR